MKHFFAAVIVVSFLLVRVPGSAAEDPTLGVLDEKVSKLAAQAEDLQFRYQQLQKAIDKFQTDLIELRKAIAAGGGAAPEELKKLEDRIAAVDAARQKDRQAIIEQLAKELSGTGAGKSPGKSTPATDTGEHVVAKSETLSSIAKTYGITVVDLKKANSLTGNDIKVGQKLVIPK